MFKDKDMSTIVYLCCGWVGRRYDLVIVKSADDVFIYNKLVFTKKK